MIGGLKEQLYVVGTNRAKNVLLVGEDKYLWHDEIGVSDLSFVSGCAPKGKLQVEARVRHLGHLEKCVLDGSRVKFARQIRAFTEGQSIVFYKGSKVIGGGIMRNGKGREGSCDFSYEKV